MTITTQQMGRLFLAAENGNADALFQVGTCYLNGGDTYGGVAKNPVTAVKYFHKAAIAGHTGAQMALAECYRDGIGMPADPEKAAQWFTTVKSQLAQERQLLEEQRGNAKATSLSQNPHHVTQQPLSASRTQQPQRAPSKLSSRQQARTYYENVHNVFCHWYCMGGRPPSDKPFSSACSALEQVSPLTIALWSVVTLVSYAAFPMCVLTVVMPQACDDTEYTVLEQAPTP